jgi:glycerate dehydrogenase
VTRPKIVVLDGYTTNPGDLSWRSLEILGELTIYERCSPEDLLPRLADAELALTNKVVLTAETLKALPKLRYVGILATGTNAVDLEAATERGIVVSNVPRYSTDSVAQLVFEAMLDAATHAQLHRTAVARGDWVNAPDFCFNVGTVRELAAKVLGIIGYGAIGRKVEQIALAFGMEVLIAESFNPAPPKAPFDSPSLAHGPKPWGERSRTPKARVPLNELLARADFVTLHCPLTDRTLKMIGANELALMKDSATLLNMARGPLVDEAALAQALALGRPAAAYLDVLSTEPPPPDHPLLHSPACKITPHIGWTSWEARGRLIEISSQNVAAFLAGTPSNVVTRVDLPGSPLG